jgi:hypothetical protein
MLRCRSVDSRERRLAENETLFRDINEQIRLTAAVYGRDEHVYHWLCECSNRNCTLRLRMPLAEYEQVREDEARFLVAPGHELPEIERVVEARPGYSLVEKLGEAKDFVTHEYPLRYWSEH